MSVRVASRMAAFAAAVALVGTASAHPASTRQYAGAIDAGAAFLIVNNNCDGALPVPTVGGACANIPSDAARLNVAVRDAHGLKIGGRWAIRGSESMAANISSGDFCSSKNGILIPPAPSTATPPLRFIVWLLGPGNALSGCVNDAPGTVGPPTTGTVTFTWLHS